jgi:hypothetical protein
MHAPNAAAIVPSTAANPDPAAPNEPEQNETKWNTGAGNAQPTLTPAPTTPHRVTLPPPRHPSDGHVPPLTPRQETAISLLCAGLNLDAVAA